MNRETTYDVFISYSRKDYVDENKNVIPGNIVSQIKDALKENGISYWMDEEGIYSGDEFAKVIAKYIKKSLVFLFVSTANSNESEWTSDEIATARMYKKKIIPFKFDESFYNEEVIIFIAKLDFIDYMSNPSEAMTKLVTAIKKHIADVEDAKKREKELQEKMLKEEEERKKRAEEEAKKEKVRDEIREKAKECQQLLVQAEVVVRQLYDKNTFIGNERKDCPVCKKISSIDATFCDKCGFQFPMLYGISGLDTFTFNDQMLTIAKTNYDTLSFLGGENEKLKQTIDSQKTSLAKMIDECKKQLEIIESNKNEISRLEKEVESLKSRSVEVNGTKPGASIVEGAIKEPFSVSDSKKVYFSKGNLQYHTIAKTWRFAEKQYDFLGYSNSSEEGWMDLFGWGTGDNPTNVSDKAKDYSSFVDWGKYGISNGGDMPGLWYTLSKKECEYLLNERKTLWDIRYAKATVNNVKGLIIVPDNWNHFQFNKPNEMKAGFDSNVIDVVLWETLEKNGAVFLPAAGGRNGLTVYSAGSFGYYWSATSFDKQNACFIYFGESVLHPAGKGGCHYGQAVRLVCPVK